MEKIKRHTLIRLTLCMISICIGLVLYCYTLLTVGFKLEILNNPFHASSLLLLFFGIIFLFIDIEKMNEKKEIEDLHIISNKWKISRIPYTAPMYWIIGICIGIGMLLLATLTAIQEYNPALFEKLKIGFLIAFLILIGFAIFIGIIGGLSV